MHAENRRAVIDLGTNTFHLLIADANDDGKLTEVYRERIFVKLASAGIDVIGTAPFSRGIAALIHFRKKLEEYHCTTLRAIGTAALRTAANGPEFVAHAQRKAQISIQLISGDEEADFITKGVLLALPPLAERVLIMDIGGGSTEFIITEGNEVCWRGSFPVGVSVLYDGYHRTDPISVEEITLLEEFLAEQLAPLSAALRIHPTRHLVGAAGTFDVLAERLRDDSAPRHPTSHRLSPDGFHPLYERIVRVDLAGRLALPDVPDERADMIVVAMILLRYVLGLAEIERITVSDYALKEGVLAS